MSYVEPTIPVATPLGDDSGLPKPVAAGIAGQIVNRAINSAYFYLDNYTVGAVVPPAVPLQGNKGYKKARVVVEKNGGSAMVIARYWVDGRWPTVTTGLPLIDQQIIELGISDDVANFRIVSCDGLQHKVNVQYFN
jgi:hypothetical protein